MNLLILQLLAFVAGSVIAMQAGLNARLGVILQSPLLATSVALTGSLVFTLFAFFVTAQTLPDQKMLQDVPVYLWFSGGLLSAFALFLFYWLIPRLGLGPMISVSLTGQLTLAILAGHSGWFHLPETPLSTVKLSGVAALMLGIFLMNRG